MQKKITTLVNENIGKALTEDFILDAFDIMRSEESDLSDQLKMIHVNRCVKGSYGRYYLNKGLIVINIDEILSDESYNDKTLLALFVLRHEIEHARTVNKFCSGEDNFENALMLSCLRKGTDEIGEYIEAIGNNNLYFVNPLERVADIRAYIYLAKMYKKIGDIESENFVLDELSRYCLSQYKVYEQDIECPTYRYLLGMQMYKNYSDLWSYLEECELTFDERILYGLPITMNEYNSGKNFQRVRV